MRVNVSTGICVYQCVCVCMSVSAQMCKWVARNACLFSIIGLVLLSNVTGQLESIWGAFEDPCPVPAATQASLPGCLPPVGLGMAMHGQG